MTAHRFSAKLEQNDLIAHLVLQKTVEPCLFVAGRIGNRGKNERLPYLPLTLDMGMKLVEVNAPASFLLAIKDVGVGLD